MKSYLAIKCVNNGNNVFVCDKNGALYYKLMDGYDVLEVDEILRLDDHLREDNRNFLMEKQIKDLKENGFENFPADLIWVIYINWLVYVNK